MNYAYAKRSTDCELIPPKHLHDAGADIRWGYDFDVDPGQVSKISTGIHLDIPEGWFAMVVPRSSNSTLGLANETGIIDCPYTGEIILKVINKTNQRVSVFEEEKHFQIILVPHMMWNLNLVDKIDKETTRGDGGFGSTDN